MGCDIHMWIEARVSENDPWQLAFPEPWTCPWCHGSGISKANEYRAATDCFLCEGAKVVSRFNERSYNLFGMLADVRNGTGFAGVRTGDGYVPISKPRGFPKDMSLGLTQHLASGNSDEDNEDFRSMGYPYPLAYQGDHSDSWLLISEILEYFADGNRVSHHQGLVSMEEYKVFLEKGSPDSWSGGVWGGGSETVSSQKMQNLLEGKELPEPGKSYYTTVHWTSTYAEDAGKAFLEYFIPACQKLGDPKNVRLVFNFDS